MFPQLFSVLSSAPTAPAQVGNKLSFAALFLNATAPNAEAALPGDTSGQSELPGMNEKQAGVPTQFADIVKNAAAVIRNIDSQGDLTPEQPISAHSAASGTKGRNGRQTAEATAEKPPGRFPLPIPCSGSPKHESQLDQSAGMNLLALVLPDQTEPMAPESCPESTASTSAAEVDCAREGIAPLAPSPQKLIAAPPDEILKVKAGLTGFAVASIHNSATTVSGTLESQSQDEALPAEPAAETESGSALLANAQPPLVAEGVHATKGVGGIFNSAAHSMQNSRAPHIVPRHNTPSETNEKVSASRDQNAGADSQLAADHSTSPATETGLKAAPRSDSVITSPRNAHSSESVATIAPTMFSPNHPTANSEPQGHPPTSASAPEKDSRWEAAVNPQLGRVDVRTTDSELRVNLRTEELGRVEIHTTVRDSHVTASVAVEDSAAKSAVVSEFAKLHAVLGTHDLQLETASVTVASEARESGMAFGGGSQQEAPPSPRHPSATPATRVLEPETEDTTESGNLNVLV